MKSVVLDRMYDLYLQADQIIKEFQKYISQYNADCFFSPWLKNYHRSVLKHIQFPSPNWTPNFTIAELDSYSDFLTTIEANKRIYHLFNQVFNTVKFI